MNMPDHLPKMRCKKQNPIARVMLVALVAGILMCATPVPAQANVVSAVQDLLKAALSWAKEAAQYVLKAEKWYEDNVQSALDRAIPVALAQIDTQIKSFHAQSEIQADRNTQLSRGLGGVVRPAITPPETKKCAVTAGNREAGAAAALANGAVGLMAAASMQSGAGTKADANSPAHVAAEVNDLCKLGFLDISGNGRYGKLPANMGCTDPATVDPKFIDADMKLSSVIGKLQYPLPVAAHVKPTADGHISFIGATKDDPYGLGSEMDFVAAWKFCEHLLPALPTPTHNSGTPGIADVLSVKGDRDEMSLRTAAASECFRAMAYRISCPLVSKGSLKDVNGVLGDCYDAQQAVCKRLKTAHDKGGQGLTMKGDDPQYELALTYCDSPADPAKAQGISQAMYDAIMAHRCHDTHYVGTLSTVLGSAAAAEHAVLFDCPDQEMEFTTKLNDEAQRLSSSIQNLILLRRMPVASGSSTARIAQ